MDLCFVRVLYLSSLSTVVTKLGMKTNVCKDNAIQSKAPKQVILFTVNGCLGCLGGLCYPSTIQNPFFWERCFSHPTVFTKYPSKSHHERKHNRPNITSLKGARLVLQFQQSKRTGCRWLNVDVVIFSKNY